jgi:hypothetical protein
MPTLPICKFEGVRPFPAKTPFKLVLVFCYILPAGRHDGEDTGGPWATPLKFPHLEIHAISQKINIVKGSFNVWNDSIEKRCRMGGCSPCSSLTNALGSPRDCSCLCRHVSLCSSLHPQLFVTRRRVECRPSPLSTTLLSTHRLWTFHDFNILSSLGICMCDKTSSTVECWHGR